MLPNSKFHYILVVVDILYYIYWFQYFNKLLYLGSSIASNHIWWNMHLIFNDHLNFKNGDILLYITNTTRRYNLNMSFKKYNHKANLRIAQTTIHT